MECAQVQELLSEYLDEMLGSSLKEEVEKHLAACDKCKKEYNLLKNIINQCNNICDEDLPDGFHEKLCSAISKEAESRKSERFGWVRKYYKAVAALVVIALSLGYIINSGVLGFNNKKSTSSIRNAATDSSPNMHSGLSTSKNPGSVASKSEAGAGANDISTTKNIISINLNSDEYKKYGSSITAIIKSYGGYAINEEPAIYMISAGEMDTVAGKLKQKLGSGNITVSSVESQISQFENNSGTKPDTKSLDTKKYELDVLNNNKGYIVIEMNITN